MKVAKNSRPRSQPAPAMISRQPSERSSRPRPRARKPTPVGSLIRETSQLLGQAMAGPIGGRVGRMAGAAISRITGNGDYTVRSNNLVTTASTYVDGQIPQFTGSGNITTVCHRDYIQDVVSPGSGFTSIPFSVNPGSSTTFPWLSVIGARFQKYRFRGLVFEFKTTSSEYASGAALGSVILASNYNTADLPFASKIAMENSSFAVSCKPSVSMIHPIECSPKESANQWYYTRDGVNALSAIQLYDLCTTTLATQGISAPGGTVLGELWVSYCVDFIEPIIPPVGVTYAGTNITTNTLYNNASSGFAQGPLCISSDLGNIFPNTSLVYATNIPAPFPAITTLIQTGPASTTGLTPTVGQAAQLYQGAIIIVNPAGVAHTSTATGTSGTTILSFARNGVYYFNAEFAGMTISLNSPWITSTNGGITFTNLLDNNSLYNNTVSFIITVTGVTTAPNAYLPYVSFANQVGALFSTYAGSLSILS